jgi:hypothetical protein
MSKRKQPLYVVCFELADGTISTLKTHGGFAISNVYPELFLHKEEAEAETVRFALVNAGKGKFYTRRTHKRGDQTPRKPIPALESQGSGIKCARIDLLIMDDKIDNKLPRALAKHINMMSVYAVKPGDIIKILPKTIVHED